MAIDSANKRFSIANLGSQWRRTVIVPDGSVSDGDRAALLGFYSGITFSQSEINTAGKRMSIVNMTMPWRRYVAVPDGSFSAGDRLALIKLYNRLVTVSVITGTGNITIGNIIVSGEESTQQPIFWRILDKIKGLKSNMTQANGYSLDYGSVDEYDPADRTYPATFFEYDEEQEIGLDAQVAEYDTVTRVIRIKTVFDSTADLDKSAHWVVADWGLFFNNYRNSLRNEGLVMYDLQESETTYRFVNSYAAEVVVSVRLKYRRNLADPFEVLFDRTNDTTTPSAFGSDKPIVINIIDQIKTQIASMTEANGYTMDYGSVDEHDPDSKTYPVTYLDFQTEDYESEDEGMAGYYESMTSLNLKVVADSVTDLDFKAQQIISDFTKMFNDNLPTLQTKGLHRYHFDASQSNYRFINSYAITALISFTLYHRRQKAAPYQT